MARKARSKTATKSKLPAVRKQKAAPPAKAKATALAMKPTPEIKFDYLKSNLFRTVHSDGVIGGITPPGNVHMSFFCERLAIPRRIIFKADINKRSSIMKLGQEIGRETRDSIVREMEVDVIMDLAAARNLHNWLEDRIKELESRHRRAARKKRKK